jgi:protein TonB
MTSARLETSPSRFSPETDRKRHIRVLLGVLAAHVGFVALFLMFPTSHSATADKPPIQLPVPLTMVMVQELSTPAPQLGSPTPQASAQPLDRPIAPPPAPVQHSHADAKPTPSPAKLSASPQSRPQAVSSSLPASAAPSTQQAASASSGITTQASSSSASGGRKSGASDAASTGPSTPTTVASTSPSNASAAISAPRFGAAYLNNPAPKYPTIAKRLGEQGRVLLRVLVSADGLAKDVRLHSSSGSTTLDDSAIKAVRHWRFIPAKQGDASVEAWVQVPIVFKLDQGDT